MSETNDDARDDASSRERTTDPTDGEPSAVTCTLDGDGKERRRAWIRENLVPHLTRVEELDDGFSFVFDRNAESYAAATELARKESQCCAWASFSVVLPSEGDAVEWRARSDREEGVAFFDDRLAETLAAFEDAPDIE
ncbi:hypothetical protein [Halopelagius longus]|uniref:Uncharacterized protein n=1 Tax=Halopelagius longus TaxID=1236180 RepID=A0A1H0YX47_9EURY|nr:hypothetical protein [Halopelagius longus]RDI72716.1 hypothetical protein DWB78_13845 [Halopelagius longus]SDQ19690.1 hypothetical protein SAMN05216278_0889 [Halopelagius longus]